MHQKAPHFAQAGDQPAPVSAQNIIDEWATAQLPLPEAPTPDRSASRGHRRITEFLR